MGIKELTNVSGVIRAALLAKIKQITVHLVKMLLEQYTTMIIILVQLHVPKATTEINKQINANYAMTSVQHATVQI